MKVAANKIPMASLRNQWLGLLLGAVTLFAVSHHAEAAGDKNIPQVIPPQASFRGLSYGQWEAEWWSSLFLIPVVGGDHPILNGGAFAIFNGVLFLCPAYFPTVDPPYRIDFTVSPGTAIFVPVISYE